jgi:hypothetical protein
MSAVVCKTRVEKETWENFKKICLNENTTASSKLRQFIVTYTSNKEKETVKTPQHIYSLVEEVYQKTGRVPRDMISRNTTPVQYEEVIEYCKKRKYKLINSPEMEKDYEGKLGTSYYDGGRAVFGNGR